MNKIFDDDVFYKIDDVAKKLNITRELLYFYIKKKKLKAIKVGKMYRLKGSDLNKFIQYINTEYENDE